MSNQDPYLENENDPSYTPLNKYLNGKKWRLSGMIGDADFAFNGNAGTLIPTGNISNKNIKVGDNVGLGNIRGKVKVVYTTTSGEVAGLQILCDSPYLPIDYQDNPSDYGYETKDSRILTVILDKENPIPAAQIPGSLKKAIHDGGTTASVTYLGTVVVFEQHTKDKSTWTQTARDVDVMQNK